MPRSQDRDQPRRSTSSRKRTRDSDRGQRSSATARATRSSGGKKQNKRRRHRESSTPSSSSEETSDSDGSSESSEGDIPRQSKATQLPTLPELPAAKNVPKLPSELEAQQRVWLYNVRNRHWLSSKTLGHDVPALDDEQYSGMTALLRDPLWHDDDTDNLEEQTKDMVGFLGARPTLPSLHQLWRIVPRFMGCLPPALFDGRNLAYDSSGNAMVKIGEANVPNPMWSCSFSSSLRLLVVHPFFNGSPALLAMAVQYAIKLRDNDRRHWPLENPTTDTFLDNLATAFRNPHPAQTSRKLHSGVRGASIRQGKVLPPMSALFREMETSIRIPAARSNASSSPFAPYMVRTSDIKAVVEALDNLHIRGAPAHLPAEYNFSWVRSGLRSNDRPSGVEGVIKAMQKAHKRDLQAETLDARRPPPPPAASNSGTAHIGHSPASTDADAIMATGTEAGPQLLAQLRAQIERLKAENEQLKAEGFLHEYSPGPNMGDGEGSVPGNAEDGERGYVEPPSSSDYISSSPVIRGRSVVPASVLPK